MGRRAEQESCGFICLLSPSVAKQEGKHKKRSRGEQKTNIKKTTMKELFWINMKTSDGLVSHRDWPWEICVLTSETEVLRRGEFYMDILKQGCLL